jgi:hypothetical protein
MTRDPITAILAVALLLTVTFTAGLCYWYLHATAQNQEAQREIARVNANRALMQPLAAESVEYGRRHTNFIPVLHSLGLRLRTETNAPSLK